MEGNGDNPQKKLDSGMELAIKLIDVTTKYASEHGRGPKVPVPLRDTMSAALTAALTPTDHVSELTIAALVDYSGFVYWLGYIAHADPEVIGLEPSKLGGDNVIPTG